MGEIVSSENILLHLSGWGRPKSNRAALNCQDNTRKHVTNSGESI